MELRDYQQALVDEIYRQWLLFQNVGLRLSTGGGKTAIFTKILRDHKGHSIAIAHRSEIVSQISLALARWGVRHNIIGQKQLIKNCVTIHMTELGASYFNPQSTTTVASVDTLLKLPAAVWFDRISLLVQDEAHHVLRTNKWGRAAALFKNAKGLYPTATPVRADGYGLGRHADGVIDVLVDGPSMRDLMRLGFLTDYRIFAPPSDLDLSNVTISASGDFSPIKLRSAVHKSHITGDIVSHYLKIAPGKLGVTFAVDIESATEIAAAFRNAGVPAEVITGKTDDVLRNNLMRRFRANEIKQLVNVDLLGEGVDVPAIEVVSMGRPTESLSLFFQQFGRALRPMNGKDKAIIIDHVGNVVRHGLPDKHRNWSLDRRERRSKSEIDPDKIPLRTCLNIMCMAVYERIYSICPNCGQKPTPQSRTAPEFVDGDLLELDEAVLAKMRGEVNRVDGQPRVPQNIPPVAQLAIAKKHRLRQEAQHTLRQGISLWAGYYRDQGYSDSEIYRRFYFKFNIDVMTAQTLGVQEAEKLNNQVRIDLGVNN